MASCPPASVAITELDASVADCVPSFTTIVNQVVTLWPAGTWPRVGVNTSPASAVSMLAMRPNCVRSGVPVTVNVPPFTVPPTASENVPFAAFDIVTVTVSTTPTFASSMATTANGSIGA